jgi:hypothetical protein
MAKLERHFDDGEKEPGLKVMLMLMDCVHLPAIWSSSRDQRFKLPVQGRD